MRTSSVTKHDDQPEPAVQRAQPRLRATPAGAVLRAPPARRCSRSARSARCARSARRRAREVLEDFVHLADRLLHLRDHPRARPSPPPPRARAPRAAASSPAASAPPRAARRAPPRPPTAARPTSRRRRPPRRRRRPRPTAPARSCGARGARLLGELAEAAQNELEVGVQLRRARPPCRPAAARPSRAPAPVSCSSSRSSRGSAAPACATIAASAPLLRSITRTFGRVARARRLQRRSSRFLCASRLLRRDDLSQAAAK